MPFRTVLLRVLFASLALAAVFGAMGILVASHETMWRVSGTSIVTAAAALLLLAVSTQLEKPPMRQTALLAFTLVVTEFLCLLGAIWDIESLFGFAYFDIPMWVTATSLFFVGVPAVALMRMATIEVTALAGRVGLALAGVQLSLFLVWAWSPRNIFGRWVTEDLAFLFAPFALLAIVSMLGKLRERPWRWAGVALAAADYAIIAYAIIRDLHEGSNVVTYIACASAAVAHANFVMLFALPPGQIWARFATIAAGCATAVFVSLAAYFGPDSGDFLSRLAGATAILGSCGTLAIMVLALLNRRVAVTGDALAGLKEIAVVCPLCRKKLTVPLGAGRCPHCHLHISVRVEEPRCRVCNYSLLMLQSGVCPECGTVVAPQAAASAADATSHEPNGDQPSVSSES